MSRPQVLFSTYAWDMVLDAQRRVLRAQVEALGREYLTSRDAQALAAALAAEHAMASPRIFSDRLSVGPARACGDPEHDFALLRAAVSQDAVYQARLPFEGDPGMFAVSPVRRPGPPPPGRIGEGFVELTVAGAGLSAELVAHHARGWAAVVGDWLSRQGESVGEHDEEMRRLAQAEIQARVRDLSAEKDLWAGLEMLKRRPAA